MRATLEFTLPDDQEEHAIALRGRASQSALWDIAQAIRSRLKYGENVSAEERNTLEEIRALIPAYVWGD